MTTLLTRREAAKTVGRSVRTIKRWKAQGMPTTRRHDGAVLVEETILKAWLRQKTLQNPVHKWRLRKIIQQNPEMDLTPDR